MLINSNIYVPVSQHMLCNEHDVCSFCIHDSNIKFEFKQRSGRNFNLAEAGSHNVVQRYTVVSHVK